MWFCNSCNIEMANTSKSTHLKTKKHSINSKITPYVPDPPVYAKDQDETLYKIYPTIYSCSFCSEKDETKFYGSTHSCCKSCKYKRGRQSHTKQYF